MIKKIKFCGRLILAAALVFGIGALFGCARQKPNDKLTVVCTIFPQYDWVRNILGERADRVDLTLLLQNRIDLHSFQPSVADIAAVSSSDMFIYVGGVSDVWVEDVLSEAVNPDIVAVSLLESLGAAVKTEEIIEGMEDPHEDGAHDHEAHEHEDEEHEAEHEGEDAHEHEAEGEEHHVEEYDEHVWLSLANAQILCAAIAEQLCVLDPDGAETYRANLAAYLETLAGLDAEYASAVNAAPRKTVLVADRFPFRYLVDDYGIAYHAAFSGCSAETEAGFDTVVFLAQKADELDLATILVTESSDLALAETVRNNTAAKNQEILVLDAMQSVATEDIEGGAAYVSVMKDNLAILARALR